MTIAHVLVRTVEEMKHTFHVKTWVVESAFVFVCLATVATTRLLVTGEGWVEWIGVLAVWASFQHAVIANRLEEREAMRTKEGKPPEVECYRKLSYYFSLKEIAWFAYFILIGAYSALVGVVVFLLYGWWRKVWRAEHPLVSRV